MNVPITRLNCVVLCGESMSGKTALFRTICGLSHQTEYTPTRISQHKLWTGSAGQELNIWDTSGEKQLRDLTKLFLENIDVAVIVVNLADSESFQSIDSWISDVRNAGRSDARNGRAETPGRSESTSRSESALIYVALNRVSESVVPQSDIDRLKAREGLHVFEINALTGDRVTAMMEDIAQTHKENRQRLEAKRTQEAREGNNTTSATPGPHDEHPEEGRWCCTLQ